MPSISTAIAILSAVMVILVVAAVAAVAAVAVTGAVAVAAVVVITIARIAIANNNVVIVAFAINAIFVTVALTNLIFFELLRTSLLTRQSSLGCLPSARLSLDSRCPGHRLNCRRKLRLCSACLFFFLLLYLHQHLPAQAVSD